MHIGQPKLRREESTKFRREREPRQLTSAAYLLLHLIKARHDAQRVACVELKRVLGVEALMKVEAADIVRSKYQLE